MHRLALLFACSLTLACAASAAASPIFVIDGRGWGHGIGMSQYGAQGFALHGKTYDQILAHYYRGTSLGTRSASVRVLLTSGRSSFPFASSKAIRGAGKSVPAGSYTVHQNGTKVAFGGKNFPSGTLFSSKALLRVDGQKFRGDVEITAGSGLAAINKLSLDSYVRGVVANESPASWEPAALEAQAVAARSYALSTGGHCGSGILCRGTSDQVYGGVGSETPSTNAAVAATKRQVVISGGSVATTFFFSTSGGKTVNKAEEWGGTDTPYLQTEKDPYDDISPHHFWGPLDPELDCPGTKHDCVYSAASMSARLGIANIEDMKVTSRNSGDRVEHVQISTPGGNKTRSGEFFRSIDQLGLRSTWFYIGVLDLAASKSRTVCGARVRLNLVVRRVGGVTLQHRPSSGGTWQNMAVTKVDRDEYYGIDRPCRGTSYRLHSPAATGLNLSVEVAPRIVFGGTQPDAPNALRGLVKPGARLAGETVFVSRKRNDGTWKRVGTATIASDGSWKSVFHVVEGTYRARVSPPASTGLVPGYSPPFTIKFS
jgi:stage II sporulation protein D